MRIGPGFFDGCNGAVKKNLEGSAALLWSWILLWLDCTQWQSGWFFGGHLYCHFHFYTDTFSTNNSLSLLYAYFKINVNPSRKGAGRDSGCEIYILPHSIRRDCHPDTKRTNITPNTVLFDLISTKLTFVIVKQLHYIYR